MSTIYKDMCISILSSRLHVVNKSCLGPAQAHAGMFLRNVACYNKPKIQVMHVKVMASSLQNYVQNKL